MSKYSKSPIVENFFFRKTTLALGIKPCVAGDSTNIQFHLDTLNMKETTGT